MTNMYDVEMLEDIARYIGLNIKGHKITQDDEFIGLIIGAKYTREKYIWNPLEDGDDTLRLAAELKIQYVFIQLPHEMGVQAYDGNSPAVYLALGNDPVKAIQRAVVKCAFEQVINDDKRM